MTNTLSERFSVQANVTYAALGIFLVSLIGVLAIVLLRVEVTPLAAGILGTVVGASGTMASGCLNYWTGASVGGKAANAALAQLAGAGPPPPAKPEPEGQ